MTHGGEGESKAQKAAANRQLSGTFGLVQTRRAAEGRRSRGTGMNRHLDAQT